MQIIRKPTVIPLLRLCLLGRLLRLSGSHMTRTGLSINLIDKLFGINNLAWTSFWHQRRVEDAVGAYQDLESGDGSENRLRSSGIPARDQGTIPGRFRTPGLRYGVEAIAARPGGPNTPGHAGLRGRELPLPPSRSWRPGASPTRLDRSNAVVDRAERR